MSLSVGMGAHKVRRTLYFRVLFVPITSRCHCLDFTSQVVPYKDTWQWQNDAIALQRAAVEAGEDTSDAILLLQHDPVYTFGTRSSMEHVLFEVENPPAARHRTEQGGGKWL